MRFSLLIAALVLAACQPLPKPFSQAGAPPPDLLRLADGRGITVQPPADGSGRRFEPLAREMVAALHGQNVPATYSDGAKASYRLTGYFTAPPAAPAVIWVLETQRGSEIGKVVQRLDDRSALDPNLTMPTATKRSASAVAALIQDPPVREAIAPPLYVGEVAGAPGDGNTRLRAAIEQFLARSDLELAASGAADSLILTGAVRVTPAQGGEQIVEIAWTVWDPFGAKVGTIAQARPVAAGSLDQNWGLIANEAALAGAAGITEMIRQIDWSQGIPPPSG